MQATIPADMSSDEQLIAAGRANRGWKIERQSDGSLVLSPPVGAGGNAREFALIALMMTWNGIPPRGRLFGLTGGFKMPDDTVFAPDIAWLRHERWNALTPQQQRGFGPVPDLCIELRSETDRRATLLQKLARYRAYGVPFVMLVDPIERSVWTGGEAPPDFPADFTSVYDA